jgi:hypothetical protein
MLTILLNKMSCCQPQQRDVVLVALEEIYNEKLAPVPQCMSGSCHPVHRKKNYCESIAIVWIQYTV